MPRLRARSSIARPTAPLWLAIDTLPAGGVAGLNVALRWTSSPSESTPMQFGPTSRMPEARADARNACSTSWPLGDASAKPAVITTATRTPAAAHCETASAAAAAGTAMIASSGTGCTSAIDATHGRPAISVACGLTAWIAPRKPPAMMLSRILRPIEPASRDAPITATDAGANSARKLRDAAVRCRALDMRTSRLPSATGTSKWYSPRSIRPRR